MDEHLERSARFVRRHQAHVYTVNIALSGDKGRMAQMPQLPEPTPEVLA